MLNCISSIGDLLWSSALTLAMAVKEVGALQGGAESKGKATQEHRENVLIRQSVPSRQQSLAGRLSCQVDACSYRRVLARTRLKELAPGRVLFAMGIIHFGLRRGEVKNK
jgi:hypothetical protein